MRYRSAEKPEYYHLQQYEQRYCPYYTIYSKRRTPLRRIVRPLAAQRTGRIGAAAARRDGRACLPLRNPLSILISRLKTTSGRSEFNKTVLPAGGHAEWVALFRSIGALICHFSGTRISSWDRLDTYLKRKERRRGNRSTASFTAYSVNRGCCRAVR